MLIVLALPGGPRARAQEGARSAVTVAVGGGGASLAGSIRVVGRFPGALTPAGRPSAGRHQLSGPLDLPADAPRPGDVDGNGEVNFQDFVRFASSFGLQAGQPGFEPRADLDGNGRVDFRDFVAFARAF